MSDDCTIYHTINNFIIMLERSLLLAESKKKPWNENLLFIRKTMYDAVHITRIEDAACLKDTPLPEVI